MALFKCTECGNMISDKASVCPHCGYPVGLIQDKANGNYDEKEHVIYDEVEYQEKSDNKKWLYAIIALLMVVLLGLVIFYMKTRNTSLFQDNDSIQIQNSSITDGKYYAVIYRDNTGGFYAPNGGRICRLELRGGRKEPLELKLNGTFMILGHNSNGLRVSNDRAFSDYSDYLNYYSDYNPDKSLGVDVKRTEKDGVLTIAFDFKEGQIANFDIVPIKIEANNNNEYIAVYYNDETGDLFDDDGSHICGFEKGFCSSDYSFNLSKTITLYGENCKEIDIYNDKVYSSSDDYRDDKFAYVQKESKAKAKVQKEEVGNTIIFHFSKNASSQGVVGKKSSDTSLNNTSSSKVSSKWTGLSKEQLSSKLNGTVWTCRPTGRMWYRMEFKNGIMVLYYADPSSGKWHKDEKEWTYEVTEGYTSDTGEKCISAQIRKPGDTLSYGALIFFKNGDIEFNWLRGRQGGKAENKDFQWE